MTKNCTVRIVTPQEYPVWDDLIRKSAQGSIFLISDFLTMLCETDLTLKKVMLGCYSQEGELKAIHAVLYRKVAGISMVCNSHFFYNGPVLPIDSGLPRSTKAEEDCTYLMALAKYLSKHFPFFPFDTHPSLLDLRPFFRLGWRADLHYTYIWKLSEFKDLWKKMRQGERKKTRKAQQLFNFKAERWADMGPEFLPIYKKLKK